MAEPPTNAAPPESSTHSDRAVAALCDLLGLMFALPFGEDLYRDTPITGTHIAYLVVGLMLAAFGHMWPKIKGAVPQRVADTVALAALDFRLWIAVALIIFIVSIGPEVYLRAAVPSQGQLSAPWLIGIGTIGVVIIAFFVLWRAQQGHANALPNDWLHRISAIEQEVAQNKAKIGQIETKLKRDQQQAELKFGNLIEALRARDAEAIVKEADKEIKSVVKKLLEEPYSDEVFWATDYALWERAIKRIDSVVSGWLREDYAPFL
jgi:hypothetical protein